MAWRLQITSVDNGYRLRGSDESDTVIQENDGDVLSHHEQLLWAVMEYFNFEGSKHDPERLLIVRKKWGE